MTGPTKPTSLSRDELLVLLIEECGEVIQAATKCLRFGWDHSQPGYGVNHVRLSCEIGDVLGVVDAIPVDPEALETRKAKIEKAERAKAAFAKAHEYRDLGGVCGDVCTKCGWSRRTIELNGWACK